MLRADHMDLIALALTGLGAYSFWYGFRSWFKTRAIEDTPVARIRSAAHGYVEIAGAGDVPPKVTIKGPLTGLQCTWWEYKIEERGGGRQRNWRTVDSMRSETAFLLDDGTGKCLVDPRGAEVVPHVHTVWYGSTEWPEYRIPDADSVVGKFFDALLAGGPYRYTERRLSVGERLCVLGEFRTSGGVGAVDPEDAILQLLHEWKSDQAKLLERFDANRNGQIDADEWEQVRAAARAQVLARQHADELQPAVPVVTQPGDGRAFLLAASDRASLARRYRLQAALSIAVFVLCAAAIASLVRAIG
jgi:hypothetical protein